MKTLLYDIKLANQFFAKVLYERYGSNTALFKV